MQEDFKPIIWINGTLNSGKTSITKLLAEQIKKLTIIELDEIAANYKNIELDKKLDVVINEAITQAQELTKKEKTPILNWPIYGKELQLAKKLSFENRLSLIMITLVPKFQVVSNKRGDRELSIWEIERIKYHYEICKICDLDFGYKIDNGELTEIETLNQALKVIEIEKII